MARFEVSITPVKEGGGCGCGSLIFIAFLIFLAWALANGYAH